MNGGIRSNVPRLRSTWRQNQICGMVHPFLETPTICHICSQRRADVKRFKKMVRKYPVPQRLEILLDIPPALSDAQLQYSWNSDDCSQYAFVEGDILTIYRYSIQCVRGKIGFTEGRHVWEICWPFNQRGLHSVVGVATAEPPLHHLVGSTDTSWGWNLGRNLLHHDSENIADKTYPAFLRPGLSFIIPGKFRVVLDMDVGTLSFVVDGQYLGVAFKGLKGKRLYPIVSAVVGFCEITMKYIVGLDPGPLSLKDLCRSVIRKRLGRKNLDEKVASLTIPKTLKPFLLYRNHK